MKINKKILLISIIFLSVTNNSYAYIGPGVGLGFIITTISILFGLLAMLFGLVWFPIKRYLNKKKMKKEN